MKTLCLEERNYFRPARSVRPGAVNQDDIFDSLRGARLRESSHGECEQQDQRGDCDQTASVYLRDFHFHLLVEPTIGIKPEARRRVYWTNVSGIPRYGLKGGHRE